MLTLRTFHRVPFPWRFKIIKEKADSQTKKTVFLPDFQPAAEFREGLFFIGEDEKAINQACPWLERPGGIEGRHGLEKHAFCFSWLDLPVIPVDPGDFLEAHFDDQAEVGFPDGQAA
jgi:hypothetical protein